MFKVNNKSLERRYWHFSVVDFEKVNVSWVISY